MQNKIQNIILVVIIAGWTVGVCLLTRQFFPRIEHNEVEPTQHVLDSLATQIAFGEIQRLQELLDAKPKVIFLPGKDSTYIDTVLVYPKGYIDITEKFFWNHVFDNETRGNDSISFCSHDSVRVTAYKDSTGNTFLGYDKFYSRIDSLRLLVSPKVFENEIINRFTLLGGLGTGIESEEIIESNILQKRYYLNFDTELMVLINEKWYFKVQGEINSRSKSVGVMVGTKFFSIGRKLK